MPQTPREATLALVKRYYDAFNRNDIPEMLACLSEDVAHDVNQGGRRVGKAKFAEFCAHMDRCYAEQLTDVVLMASEDGKTAAAEFVVNGVYKATDSDLPPAKGQKYRLPAGAFLAIADGRITRVTTYYNLQDWIAQVGK